MSYLTTTAYAPLTTSRSHHLAKLPSTITILRPSHPTPLPRKLYSNQPDPNRDHVHSPPYIIPLQDNPYPLPTRPTLTHQPNPPTPPYPLHILLYPPNPRPSFPCMLTPLQRLSSVQARRTSGGFARPRLLNTNLKHRLYINAYFLMNKD